MRRLLIVAQLFLVYQSNAAREYFVYTYPTSQWFNDSTENYNFECNITNPQSISQSVTLSGVYVNSAGFNSKTSSGNSFGPINVTLDEDETYNYAASAANDGNADFPMYLKISISENTGFLIGGCRHFWQGIDGIGTSNAYLSGAYTAIPINQGKPF